MRISVIIVNWNGKHFLEGCLTSLREQTFKDFEIILIDNGSTDGSPEFAKAHFPEVTVVGLPQNYGFCVANNVGIRRSQGEYVALLNNDAEASPRWLQALAGALDSNPQVGFCASKMLLYDHPDIVDSAGDIFHTCGVGDKRGRQQRDDGQFDEITSVFGACAGAALYRRQMLEDVGLFDEDFFAYDEDIDLSFRAQLNGYQCLFVPDAVVYHHLKGTSRKLPEKSLYLARRNALYVLVKNMPTGLLCRRLPYILCYYFAGDVSYITRGSWKPVLRARLHNLTHVRKTLASRREIQADRRVSNEYLNSVMTPGRVRGILRKTLGNLQGR